MRWFTDDETTDDSATTDGRSKLTENGLGFRGVPSSGAGVTAPWTNILMYLCSIKLVSSKNNFLPWNLRSHE